MIQLITIYKQLPLLIPFVNLIDTTAGIFIQLFLQGREFPVTAGQAFIIFPDEVTTYTADDCDPSITNGSALTESFRTVFGNCPVYLALGETYFPS